LDPKLTPQKRARRR